MTQVQEKALEVIKRLMDNLTIDGCPYTSSDIITLIKSILSNEKDNHSLKEVANEKDNHSLKEVANNTTNQFDPQTFTYTPRRIIKDPETGLWRYEDSNEKVFDK